MMYNELMHIADPVLLSNEILDVFGRIGFEFCAITDAAAISANITIAFLIVFIG